MTDVVFGRDATIKNARNFDLEQIFECGQAFRFDRDAAFDGVRYTGVAMGKYLSVRKDGENVVFEGVGREEFYSVWFDYFDLGRDYGAIIDGISDAHARLCAEAGSGIRILRQDPWETVCSFIVSQNNNIPRIKKIIGTLCERFGEKLGGRGAGFYSFPTAEALYKAGEDAIFDCRTGFRAKYIYDAARRVATGEFDIESARALSADKLTAELLKIKGVGPKVAACAGLFGFAHYESFPVDVWIKRVIDKYYGEGFDPSVFGKYAGICQQYLFYYERGLEK